MNEKEWMIIFGNNLKEILNEQGYTQRDLAESTGISEASISGYIKGIKMPGIRAIINMSYELGIPLDDFIDFGSRIE